MKIGIQHKKDSFSEGWIEYCQKNNIQYKLVNVYKNDIIQQLSDCDIFLWHHSNYDYRDALFSKQLLFSLQKKGIKVFPNYDTNWHFDDKVGQKYLLEAINAPIIPSYVFYTKKEALEWIGLTSFPKVFKLRGGSGSSNVKLIKTRAEAKKIINRAFGAGFSQFDALTHLKYRIEKFRSGKEGFSGVLKGFIRLFIGADFSNKYPKEKSYAYFQDFIPNNDSDIRVIVIGNKAFAIKRMVRNNDFRASGSGNIVYNIEAIPEKCIKIAFSVCDKIGAQSLAFDFVFDEKLEPKIIEISYGFVPDAYKYCPGYWDQKLVFHKKDINSGCFILEDLIKGNNG